jgi:hypothetical protein
MWCYGLHLYQIIFSYLVSYSLTFLRRRDSRSISLLPLRAPQPVDYGVSSADSLPLKGLETRTGKVQEVDIAAYLYSGG